VAVVLAVVQTEPIGQVLLQVLEVLDIQVLLQVLLQIMVAEAVVAQLELEH
jgi:hypothetical protein